MAAPNVIHDTFVLERNYPKPPERVFAAFSDPAKKSRWYAHGDHTDLLEYVSDFRVGGTERALSRFKEGTPFPGALMVMEGFYLEIVAEQRIVMASTMAFGDRRFSASLGTFEFLATAAGTNLIFTHQGAFFEGSDGPERRAEGWEKILDQLDIELGCEPGS